MIVYKLIKYNDHWCLVVLLSFSEYHYYLENSNVYFNVYFDEANIKPAWDNYAIWVMNFFSHQVFFWILLSYFI